MSAAADRLSQSIPADWRAELADVVAREPFRRLADFLQQERARHAIHPRQEDLFAALRLTALANVRAVILGQDPYHGPGQAHGLSFSVARGVRPPPSLVNIFRELQDDLGLPGPDHGCLKAWAVSGVLLLNVVLTVRSGVAHSHRGKGWESLTDAIIAAVNRNQPCAAFLLWGQAAQAKASLIDQDRHVVLMSPHPSPFSARRGFLGSRPFSRANQELQRRGLDPVDWSLAEG